MEKLFANLYFIRVSYPKCIKNFNSTTKNNSNEKEAKNLDFSLKKIYTYKWPTYI